MNIMNNETSQIATDLNNLGSDTDQVGTGIGQSSPNIDLDAGKEDYKYTPHTFNNGKSSNEITKQNDKLIEERKYREKTHGEIMNDIQNYESEYDQLKELQELYRSNSLADQIKAKKLADKLGINPNKGKVPRNQLGNTELADQLNPRITELLNNIKRLKEHNNFDNRTDEQKRSDKLLEDQREREDTVAQRGTQDMLKAGLHPASANYGGSVGGSSGSGGGGGGSESEKEKERRRRRKKYLEEKRRERQREIMQILGRIGAAGTLGAVNNTGFISKNMNNPTTTSTGTIKTNYTTNMNKKPKISEEIIINNDNYNNWRKESKSNAEKYFAAVEKLDTKLPRNEWNKKINELKDKYNM